MNSQYINDFLKQGLGFGDGGWLLVKINSKNNLWG